MSDAEILTTVLGRRAGVDVHGNLILNRADGSQIVVDLNNVSYDPISQELVTADGNVVTITQGVTVALLNASLASILTQAQEREGHTGFDPAQNVNVHLASNGQTITLQAYIDALEVRLTTLGSTAPVNTVQPTAPTGTKTVGSTLTAVTGTWTGASTYNYIWYRVNPTTGAIAATGGTAATYVLQAADATFLMAVSVAGVSAAGVIAAPVLSATTTAVGVTLPTISVAPAVTPSGTQAVGVLLTSTTGTWNNATSAVYTYQWTFNGANITGATSSTYTIITGQEGGAIVCKVLATTTQGAAAAAASSNTITVASAPALTAVSAPAFPATVTVGIGAAITLSTWNHTPDTSRTFRFYIAEGTGGLTTPYATIVGSSATYTPEADNTDPASFLVSHTGLTSLVGKTVYVDEVVTYLGNTYTSAKSAGKVIAAPSATLTASTQSTALAWTQNAAITAVKPVSATGGTTPYSYAITPSTTALPAGLTLNSSTGFISGTPTTQSTLTIYSITVTDAAGTPATSASTFTATVSAAGATALPFINSPSYGIEAPTDEGGTVDATDYPEKGYTNGASLPPLSNITTIRKGGVVRLGPVTRGGFPFVYHHTVAGDPLRHGGVRAELPWDGFQFRNGQEVWRAGVMVLGPDCAYASIGGFNEGTLLAQVHQEPTITLGTPLGRYLIGSTSPSTRYTKGINWITTISGPSASDTPIYVLEIPNNTVARIIERMRPGFAASGDNPILEVWVALGTGSYTKLTARTDFAAAGANADWGDSLCTVSGGSHYFMKDGIYHYGSDGSSSTRTILSVGAYAAVGTSLFNNAAAAIDGYASSSTSLLP